MIDSFAVVAGVVLAVNVACWGVVVGWITHFALIRYARRTITPSNVLVIISGISGASAVSIAGTLVANGYLGLPSYIQAGMGTSPGVGILVGFFLYYHLEASKGR